MKVKNVSAQKWTGADGFATVSIAPGDTVEMSEARAKLLVADFPGDFELVGAVAPKPAKEIADLSPESTEDDEDGDEKPRKRGRKGK